MDIIVTTPKSQMAAAAREAADCIAAGGGEYFRRFPRAFRPVVRPNDRVYYVEDGYVRGFALVDRTALENHTRTCRTTGRQWPPGFYVFMNAKTWQWIRPIPMRGFQGYRYADQYFSRRAVEIVGGWLDPRAEDLCPARASTSALNVDQHIARTRASGSLFLRQISHDG